MLSHKADDDDQLDQYLERRFLNPHGRDSIERIDYANLGFTGEKFRVFRSEFFPKVGNRSAHEISIRQ